MRPWLLLCILLSGCGDDARPAEEQAGNDVPPDGNPDPPPRIQNETNMQSVVTIVEERVAIPANTCTPAMQQHDDMFTFTVDEATRLWANFTRIQEPQGVFATNIRLYTPDGNLADQEAWSGQGDMQFSFEDPVAGTWTTRLLHCDLPMGEHIIDAHVQLHSG